MTNVLFQFKTCLQNVFKSGRLVLLLSGLLLVPVLIQPAWSEDKMALNFSDTDINAVIGAVAKLTGKNFIIDPRVKGKVTVITHQSLSPAEVYQVFISVLKVHGFAAIPGNGAIKIVPEVNAKQDSIPNSYNSKFEDGDEVVTQVIKIQNVDAAQLVPILRPLVPQRGHLAAYPASNVIIISDSAANIARISQIIRRIDLAVRDKVEVIQLQHATASDIVRTVTQLKPNDPKSVAGYNLVADDRTNSILLSGEPTARLYVRTIITHMDTPVETGGNTHVVYLRYAKAKDLVPVLTGVGKSVGQPTTKGKVVSQQRQGDIQIQADESSNALVINAPPAIIRSLRAVIRKLDIRRAQVLVEAVIAEVSYTKFKELGIQWYVDGTLGGSSTGPVGLINFGGAPVPFLSDPPDLSGVGDGFSLGLGSYKNGSLQVGMLLRTLAGDSTTNVLSTPTLVTLDNEEAEIIVGQNVPFVTGSYSSTGDGTSATNPFQTIQRQDVGITLKIKPQINEGNAIKLDIKQEVSSVSTDAVATDIITNKRSITTSVMVEDDQVLVLGGLVEDQVDEIEQKVPGLGDIPLLGWLFKYKSEKKIKKNLMVFIHPKIIKDKNSIAQETGDKYNYLRSQQLAERENGLSFMDNNNIPVLNDLGLARPLPPRYTPQATATKAAVYNIPPPEDFD
ncbi:MAG: type II secretion system secretin GspD [Gammaproteobacteria bacterium]|nr:type II secretion system secretin GspD [Gammaproteobacteria bacterium]